MTGTTSFLVVISLTFPSVFGVECCQVVTTTVMTLTSPEIRPNDARRAMANVANSIYFQYNYTIGHNWGILFSMSSTFEFTI